MNPPSRVCRGRRRRLFTLATALSALIGLCATAAEPTKILLIGAPKDGHPYRTHEYMPACELLAKCLRQTPGVETVVSDGWPRDEAALSGAQAIVLYLPWGSNALFEGPQREAAKRLLSAGAGLAAIHWATGAEKDEYGQLWLDQLGGWFNRDFSTLEHIERELSLADPAHETCRGVAGFKMFDEYYFNLRFAPTAKPLLTTERDGKPQTIAWAYERPKARDGRSFGCVAGHYHENFGNEAFRRFLTNGILWTARREIPPTGAPCQIDAGDLDVPKPAQ